MRKSSKIKLSKKTKKQILDYLQYRKNLVLDEISYNINEVMSNDNHYLLRLFAYLDMLYLDIEFYGMK